MEIEKLTFPLTLDAFIAFQEAAAGREASENVREVCEAYLPLFNASYVEGQSNDTEGVIASMDTVGEFIALHDGDTALVQILRGLRYWIIYAWKRGREAAE